MGEKGRDWEREGDCVRKKEREGDSREREIAERGR
jgi:hypothetical protein